MRLPLKIGSLRRDRPEENVLERRVALVLGRADAILEILFDHLCEVALQLRSPEVFQNFRPVGRRMELPQVRLHLVRQNLQGCRFADTVPEHSNTSSRSNQLVAAADSPHHSTSPPPCCTVADGRTFSFPLQVCVWAPAHVVVAGGL